MTPERLAEIRERCENGADSLELLLDCLGNGINVLDHTSKGRDNWINDLKRYQADHVGLLAYVDELRDKLADYENRITWHTTCQQCATVLDRAVADHERAERALAECDQARDIARAYRRAPSAIRIPWSAPDTPLIELADRIVTDVLNLAALPDWLTDTTNGD